MRKRNIYLLCAITFLQGMVFYAAVATLYRQAAGLSVFQITAIEGISVALSMALEIPWGWAADRLGYRRVMILCNALFLVTKIIFWRAEKASGLPLTERPLPALVISGLSRRGRQHAVSFCPAPGCPAQFRLVFCRRRGGRAAVRPALHSLSQRPIPANGAVDGGYLCAGCPVDLIFAGSAPRGRPKAAGAPGQAGPDAFPRAGHAGAGDLRRGILRDCPLRDDLL